MVPFDITILRHDNQRSNPVSRCTRIHCHIKYTDTEQELDDRKGDVDGRIKEGIYPPCPFKEK